MNDPRYDSSSYLKSVGHMCECGDIVVVAHVGFNPGHWTEKYPQPACFTVVNGKPGTLTLQHSGGDIIQPEQAENVRSYLFPPQQVFDWMKAVREHDADRSEREIRILQIEKALLRDILTKQGVRVVTEAQFQQLGLKA